MFELSEESDLMTSSDKTVKLTTHRIIYESDKGKQQVMLQDFVSYELKRSSIGYYVVPLSIFLCLATFIVVNKIINFYSFSGTFYSTILESFWDDKGFLVLLAVLMVFHFFYLISRRYYIKINGKYNSIEFRVTSLNNPSIKRMLEKITEQSNKVKNATAMNGRKEN